MLEVEMRVAARELEQVVGVGKASVSIRIHVRERTSNEDVTLPDVWSRNGKPDHLVRPGRDSAFDDAAEIRGEIFDSRHPVVLCGLAVDSEVRERRCVYGILNGSHIWLFTGLDSCRAIGIGTGNCQKSNCGERNETAHQNLLVL